MWLLVAAESHLRAKTNILKHARYIGEMKLPNDYIADIKNSYGAFRMTHLYKY